MGVAEYGSGIFSLRAGGLMNARAEQQPVVLVVDDDAGMREALSSLFRSVGLDVKTFASTPEFLQSKLPDGPTCLVLDVRLPGLSGLDLQRELTQAGIQLPIIFITGHGDIPMSVQAMKAGAVEFLTKPFRHQDLLDAIQQAIDRDRMARRKRAEMADLRRRLDSLTPRERQVMGLVVAGLLNKQIAAELGTSEITIKVHRGQVMRKMQARSLVALVRMADRLGGHLVLGHVDCTGRVSDIAAQGSSRLLTISYPESFARYVVPVGSIAVDGISLTIARLREGTFSVAIIPHTLEKTTIGSASAGTEVNLEFDILGKYVERLLTPPGGRSKISAEKLREWGYEI